MRDPVVAYLALGANLGDAAAHVRQALADLAGLPQTDLLRESSLYSSAPLDAHGANYVNAVAQVATGLTAPALLEQLQGLELRAGRQRPYRNAPRTLDLDLLLFGQARICSATLLLPHPRMWQRAFVLLPLAEIAPDLVSAKCLAAVSGQTISRMRAKPPCRALPNH